MSIHQKNLQILATEIYKTKKDLGPKIMKDTFHFTQKPYNLRNDPELQRRRKRAVYFGTESISSLAPKIWELIPNDIRSANSLGIFKEKIKFWATDKCPCRLCKTYIGNVGFIVKCSKERKHTTCGVTLSSFSNDSLCNANFYVGTLTNNNFATIM